VPKWKYPANWLAHEDWKNDITLDYLPVDVMLALHDSE